MKAVLAAQTQPRFLGCTDHWSRRIIFPNSGNPNGFPKAGGIALGVPHRGRLRPAPGSRHDVLFRARFRVGILEIGSRVRFLAVRFDQWVPFSIDVKWSYGSDGFTKFVIGGETLVDRTGPSLPTGQTPKTPVRLLRGSAAP
jgi:hypothetical protein